MSSGHEGRIGMAAVTLKEGEDFDCTDTYKQVVNYLPAYARPRFIRIQVRLTATQLEISFHLNSICPVSNNPSRFVAVPGDDGDVQDEESEAGGGGIQPGARHRSVIFP